MTRKLFSPDDVKIEAIYTIIWQKFKLFPQGLAAGSKNPPTGSGTAAAALISAGIGCFSMMVTQHFTATNKEIDKIVWQLGSWIPGSYNDNKLYGEIGSYSGKETILLISWLVSWVILHQLFKNSNIKPRIMYFWMFILFIAATAMSWHPLFYYLPLM